MTNQNEVDANNALAKRYYEIWDTYPIQRLTKRIEHNWIKAMVEPGQSVMLAGSGGGREIEALLDIAGRIVAIDISDEMLKIGKERFPDARIEWHLGDIHSLPDNLSGFNHVFSLGGVFAYLKNPDLAIKELIDTLSPKGMLTICVMNSQHPTEKSGHVSLGGDRIRHPYSIKELKTLMSSNGLNIETVKGYRFFVDNLPKEWNQELNIKEGIKEIMEDAIELEMKLINYMPADEAKFIWMSGQYK